MRIFVAGDRSEEVRGTKRCDLCDQREFELISRIDRRRRPLDTEVCTHCGLVSHRQIPSERELAEFYATQYRWAYHREITPSPRRVMRAWRNGQRIYRQVAPWLAPRSSVFDVGAGIGCTVKVFEQQGHDSSGIEPNDGFHAYAQEQLQAAVAKEFLFDQALVPAYDLVLLVHVIEHFRSPKTALAQVHRLIKPGGLLYVECPNLGTVARPGKLFHFAHIHNFTPETLSSMALHGGFEVVHWCVSPLAPNLQVLLKRIDNPRREIPADAYRRTMQALHRFNFWSYHLRWDYLSLRCLELIDTLREWSIAPMYVRGILQQCAGSRHGSPERVRAKSTKAGDSAPRKAA